MDIFALCPVPTATVAPGTTIRAARTALDGLADHRTGYDPQRARPAPRCIDNDRIPRYLMARRDKKAA
ncbi:hypothetical protein [Bradyrhizobium sp. STM 3809]|uniref:hypothetical protein n=1 Tax=Bradyrhizobium sp. STM 3809 TaxID=551936 RepID=UPI00024099B1|nr:hypothetical protein [Bradyrhizobium sp. STM 3809]CCE02843.1 hypothetical protein BRAS3809_6640014 [Bradyrhizobium sp. STM 3809]